MRQIRHHLQVVLQLLVVFGSHSTLQLTPLLLSIFIRKTNEKLQRSVSQNTLI